MILRFFTEAHALSKMLKSTLQHAHDNNANRHILIQPLNTFANQHCITMGSAGMCRYVVKHQSIGHLYLLHVMVLEEKLSEHQSNYNLSSGDLEYPQLIVWQSMQQFAKVIMIHPLGTVNICIKLYRIVVKIFYSKPQMSTSLWYERKSQRIRGSKVHPLVTMNICI